MVVKKKKKKKTSSVRAPKVPVANEVEPLDMRPDEAGLKEFLNGKITLGEFEGVDKESQYQMAQMGYHFVEQGKLDEANSIFEGLIALDPKDGYFSMALGVVAQRQERYEDAEHWYSLAIEGDKKNPIIYANRGEARMNSGNLKGAVNDLVKALTLDPEAKEQTTQRARGLLLQVQSELNAAKRK